MLETAELELQRISEIFGRTLRIHKQAAGPHRTGSRELILSALSIFEGKLRNTHITVLPGAFAEQHFVCLEGEIRQVLGNLIGNAIDAMPHGGRSACAAGMSPPSGLARPGLFSRSSIPAPA